LEEKIIPGDMPGDKVEINNTHINRAEVLFPHLLEKINKLNRDKVVISVYGGSGVGKSEIGSLLSHYLREEGLETYLLSGDNYPHRIPKENDRERENRFREAGLVALSLEKDFEDSWSSRLKESWESGVELNDEFYNIYFEAGESALREYLGTEKEINFRLINSIISRFLNNETSIPLKRMGREIDDLWFEKVDFKNIKVLIIEWTHGNNNLLNGVDIPIFLFSTPKETLEHRLSRGRDKGVDSPFTNLVLSLEQEKLNSQADRASLIISKSGELLSLEDFKLRSME